jgi:HemY protein
MKHLLAITIFLVKLALLGAVVAWFLMYPGTVKIDWQGTTVETGVGTAAAVILVFAFLFGLVYHGWRTMLGWPKLWRERRQLKLMTLGYRAIDKGLLAIASGDATTASKHAKKALSLLPDVATAHLLAAQAAQLNHDDVAADTHLAKLAQHPEGQVFGLRGQINRALSRQDRTEAIRLARLAYVEQSEQPWIIDTNVQLEARARNWIQVEKILKKAVTLKTAESVRWQKDLAAALLAQSDAMKEAGDLEAALDCAREALKRQAGWTPAVLRVAELWHKKGYKRRAQKTLSEAWETNPHPDLLKLWVAVSAGERENGMMDRVDKLVGVNPDCYESAFAMAEASYKSMLWGVARQHAERALSYRADRAAFRLMAEIERGDGNDAKRIQSWLEKAAEAMPEKQWLCSITQMRFDMWQALNHQLDFNTIQWEAPATVSPSAALLPAA